MPQLSLSIEEVITATGIGRTKLYELMGSGELKARKIGTRTVILLSDLESYLLNLQVYSKTVAGSSSQ